MGLKEQMGQMIRGELPPPPIVETMGLRLAKYGEGEARVEIEVDERYHNPHGTLHGGIPALLADMAMGVAVISLLEEDETFTTLELKINYIRPVIAGTLVADGKVVHKGARTIVVESTVTNSDGKMVARATSTCLLFKNGPLK